VFVIGEEKMGLTEAKKYIQDLHRKQGDPYLWPDFLTGLPDRKAIIRRLEDLFPRLGKYSIAYVRISNIHPYLIKYGPDRHAEIIQWAAAILKTTCDKCSGCFVGTLSTHDFVVMCETDRMVRHIEEAGRLFEKKIKSFYSAEDLRTTTTLSFRRGREKVHAGLLKLTAVVAQDKPGIEKSELLQHMGHLCESAERTADEIVLMTGNTASAGL
jgi:GGDEF domain-containing protein